MKRVVALRTAAALAVLGVCSTAHAANINWLNGVSGNFNDGTKWGGGMPPSMPNDAAIFFVNGDATYTVTFSGNPSISNTTVTTHNHVTFLTSGAAQTLTTTTLNVGSASSILTLGTSPAPLLISTAQVNVDTDGRLNINADNDIATGACKVGGLGDGTVTVDGAGSTLACSGAMSIVANAASMFPRGTVTFSNSAAGSVVTLDVGAVSALSTATLNVQSDADLTASGEVRVGTGSSTGQVATMTVTGAGSTFAQSGAFGFTVGAVMRSTGTLAVTSGGTFTTGSGTNTVAATGKFNVVGGNFTLNGNTTVSGAVNVTNNGNFSVADTKSLTISSTGTFNITASAVRTDALTITGGVMTLNSGTLSIGSALSITAGGKLNLKDNLLVVRNGTTGTVSGTTYTGITGLVKSGRNGNAAPLWDGSGIVTTQTLATTGNLHSIGVARASDIRPATATTTALWGGQTISGSDTLVMYTYGGDANLDGRIDVDDYIRIDTGIAAGLTGWSNGDFNYDSKVNIDDYNTFIDANIGNQSGFVFPTASGIDSAVVTVPEPAALILLLPLGLPLRGRRRRAFNPSRSTA